MNMCVNSMRSGKLNYKGNRKILLLFAYFTPIRNLNFLPVRHLVFRPDRLGDLLPVGDLFLFPCWDFLFNCHRLLNDLINKKCHIQISQLVLNATDLSNIAIIILCKFAYVSYASTRNDFSNGKLCFFMFCNCTLGINCSLKF